MSKKPDCSAARNLFELELNHREKAIAFVDADTDETRESLRDAALLFAEAWNACGAAKGRP